MLWLAFSCFYLLSSNELAIRLRMNSPAFSHPDNTFLDLVEHSEIANAGDLDRKQLQLYSHHDRP